MPESAYLSNNAGVSYIKTHNLDSAIYFLNIARDNKKIHNTAETNFFAMAALELVPLKADSVVKVFHTDSPGTLANAVALSSIVNTPLDLKQNPLENKRLDLYTATLLNNYIVKNAKVVDTVFINEAYKIASDSVNANFSEALKSSLAFAYYHQGNIAKALEILAEQVYLSQAYQGKFNYIMGLWALEQNNPELAASYFDFSDTFKYKQAKFYHAISLTEQGEVYKALTAWDTLSVKGDEAQKAIANHMRNILTIPTAEAYALKDADKYQFCRYRINLSDSLLFNKLSNTFENPNYEAQALLDYSKRYFEADQLLPAIHYYRRIAGLRLTDKSLYEEVRHFELRLLAYRKEVRALATQINKGLEFKGGRNLEKIYYTALINEASGDTVNARKNYSVLARYNPYFEEGVLAAYRFFKGKSTKGFYAYTILAEALQINRNSIPLLKAYYNESRMIGFDEYAANALERLKELGVE
jgi:hypothetical protein